MSGGTWTYPVIADSSEIESRLHAQAGIEANETNSCRDKAPGPFLDWSAPDVESKYRSGSSGPESIHPEAAVTKHTILTLACLGVVAVQPAAPQATPQASVDPYFTSSGTWGQPADDQWAIKQVGFTGGADSAWSLAGTDLEPVNVAVIDTGLDWHHLDVDAENIWRNEGETPYNNIDDDGNGYVDDVIGWNFFGRNGDAWDHDGHGTMVAGIIAARRGNGVGIAGINPAARIMVLKGVNNFGHTRASYVAEAIKYAADNGARIINMSLAGTGSDRDRVGRHRLRGRERCADSSPQPATRAAALPSAVW